MSDVPAGPVRSPEPVPSAGPIRRWYASAQRFDGLSAPGRGYTLTVVALVALASVPTVAAATAGTAALKAGTPRRSPFIVQRPGPSVVVVPDRGVAMPPALVRARQVAPPTEPLVPIRAAAGAPVRDPRPVAPRQSAPPVSEQPKHPPVGKQPKQPFARRPKPGDDHWRAPWRHRTTGHQGGRR